MRNLILSLIVLSTIVTGCASVPQGQDTKNRMSVASKSLGNEFSFFYVPSVGAIADTTFVAMSKSSGPSSMAHQLAAELAKGTNNLQKIAASGPAAAKTFQVIKDAFSLLKDQKVSKLEFMYVGSEAYKVEIQSLVESVGGKFVFAEY